MKIEGVSSTLFKIGWAFDYRVRERGFNFVSLPQLGGVRYKTLLTELWDTARAAFKMEQALLRRLDDRRHPSNREVVCGIGLEAFQSAWAQCLQDMHSTPNDERRRT
jgi:hypothetical protein